MSPILLPLIACSSVVFLYTTTKQTSTLSTLKKSLNSWLSSDKVIEEAGFTKLSEDSQTTRHRDVSLSIGSLTGWDSELYTPAKNGSPITDPNNILNGVNQESKVTTYKLSGLAMMKVGSALTAILDTTTQYINKRATELLEAGSYSTAAFASAINILISIGRFITKHFWTDTKKVQSIAEHSQKLREQLMRKKAVDTNVSMSHTDSVYANYADYHATLWELSVGFFFRLMTVFVSRINIFLLLPLIVVYAIKDKILSLMTHILLKTKKTHSSIENQTIAYYNNPENLGLSNQHYVLAAFVSTYNKRVLFESISAMTSKCIDQIQKYLLLRLFLSALLTGKMAYTSLMPSLIILDGLARSFNFRGNTQKPVNEFKNSMDQVTKITDLTDKQTNIHGGSSTNQLNPSIETLWTRILKQSGIQHIWFSVIHAGNMPLKSQLKIIALFCLFVVIQFTQVYFGIESMKVFKSLLDAISLHKELLSLRMMAKLLHMDVMREICAGIQKYLLRFICSNWAVDSRMLNAKNVLNSPSQPNIDKGKLIVKDTKDLIDQTGELINQYSLAIFNIALIIQSLSQFSFMPQLIACMISLVVIKTVLLLCLNDRPQEQKEKQSADDECRNKYANNLDLSSEIATYKTKYINDALGDNFVTNFGVLTSTLAEGLVYLGSGILICSDQLSKPNLSKVTTMARNLYDGFDISSRCNYNVVTLGNARSRL